MNVPIIDPDAKEDRKKILVDYFSTNRHNHEFYAFREEQFFIDFNATISQTRGRLHFVFFSSQSCIIIFLYIPICWQSHFESCPFIDSSSVSC